MPLRQHDSACPLTSARMTAFPVFYLGSVGRTHGNPGLPAGASQPRRGPANALVAARLCDIAPDGASRLVSWGLLNLTHRDGSHVTKTARTGCRFITIKMQLNVAAHRLSPGHRWRVAVSPTYWPHAWPSPTAVRLTLHTGPESRLVLPVRPASKLDDTLAPFGAPEGCPPAGV